LLIFPFGDQMLSPKSLRVLVSSGLLANAAGSMVVSFAKWWLLRRLPEVLAEPKLDLLRSSAPKSPKSLSPSFFSSPP
jgi:hypothetical protein